MTRQSVLMNAALLLSALLSTATVLTTAASSTGFEAARTGDIEGMEAAMRDGLDIDAREEKSEQTMLMAASLAGDTPLSARLGNTATLPPTPTPSLHLSNRFLI
jgi:hypothetical protein